VTRLNVAAKAALREAGVTQAAWAREHFTDGKWHGDECGCIDDRCIGYHHGENDDCGCLPALLATYLRERTAMRDEGIAAGIPAGVVGKMLDRGLRLVGETTPPPPGRPVTGDQVVMNGPFETADQARELPQVRAIYESWEPGRHLADGARQLLRQALDDAGVSLGAYDQALTRFISGFEPQVVAVIASWVTRARAADGDRIRPRGGRISIVPRRSGPPPSRPVRR
jgi:hypothetical protein